jgi:hypothetical protein
MRNISLMEECSIECEFIDKGTYHMHLLLCDRNQLVRRTFRMPSIEVASVC